MTTPALRVAVLVPCYNEEAAVATVVADFRKALPTAAIFVYDNNSRDRTREVARAAGAVVRSDCSCELALSAASSAPWPVDSMCTV